MPPTPAPIQEIVASDHGKITHVSQTMNNTFQAEKKIYFDLKLAERFAANNSPEPDREDVRTIKPGKSYEVQIFNSDKSYSERYIRQLEVSSGSKIEFELKFAENSEVMSKIPLERKIQVDGDNIASFKANRGEFTFTVPDDCTKGTVQIQLLYRELEGANIPKFATVMELKLESSRNPVDAEFVREAMVDINAAFQENVARLFAEQPGEEKIHLRCFYEFSPIDRPIDPLSFETTTWEPIRVADFIETPEQRKDTLEKLRRNSTGALKKLTDWLKNFLKRQVESPCIVITDKQNFEIPWEMLVLDRNFLGAQATVVRWKELESSRRLKVEDVVYQGVVVAYLDDEESEIQEVYAERVTLEAVKAIDYRCLDVLKQYILNLPSLEGIGLIYIGCHGHHGMDSHGRRALAKRITDLDFDFGFYLKEYEDARPVIFVNTYESARLQSAGLMDILLSRLVSSYIGTLGPVSPDYASKVASSVLEKAYNNPNGVRIAEVLRDLRAEAVKEWTRQRLFTEDFFHAFMYVYYGNPFIALRLVEPEETGAGT